MGQMTSAKRMHTVLSCENNGRNSHQNRSKKAERPATARQQEIQLFENTVAYECEKTPGRRVIDEALS
jgi:hypothetical protein